MVRLHLGKTQEEVDSLTDEEFTEAAAFAFFIEDRRALAVKRGILMALQEIVE